MNLTRSSLKEHGITLKAIVAMAANRVMGKDGRLPWHIPDDLRQFKRLTMGKPMLMGRKTFESLGGILPGRRHLVLSQTMPETEGVDILRRPRDIVHPGLNVSGTVHVIGGAAVFEDWLPLCDEIYVSLLHKDYEGNTVMPDFEEMFEKVKVVERYSEFDVILYARTNVMTRL